MSSAERLIAIGWAGGATGTGEFEYCFRPREAFLRLAILTTRRTDERSAAHLAQGWKHATEKGRGWDPIQGEDISQAPQ